MRHGPHDWLIPEVDGTFSAYKYFSVFNLTTTQPTRKKRHGGCSDEDVHSFGGNVYHVHQHVHVQPSNQCAKASDPEPGSPKPKLACCASKEQFDYIVGLSIIFNHGPFVETMDSSTNEIEPGQVSSYVVAANGTVTLVDNTPSLGDDPAHLAVIKNGTEVIAPNVRGPRSPLRLARSQ